MELDNRQAAFEELGPTPRLISGGRPTPNLKPSAAIRAIIAELGLRYRPSAQTDLEAHAAQLSLLSVDVADLPVHILRDVAKQWARESNFMPKAAELIARCRARTMQQGGGNDCNRYSRENALKLAERYNARLAADGKYARWIVDEQNHLKLETP